MVHQQRWIGCVPHSTADCPDIPFVGPRSGSGQFCVREFAGFTGCALPMKICGVYVEPFNLQFEWEPVRWMRRLVGVCPRRYESVVFSYDGIQFIDSDEINCQYAFEELSPINVCRDVRDVKRPQFAP